MKKNYFYKLIYLFIFCLYFNLESNAQEVTFTETEINFGSVDVGSQKNNQELGIFLNFTFKNDTNPADVFKISNIYFRGDNKDDFYQNNNLGPGFSLRNGDQYSFVIHFAPKSAGNKTAELVFEYEDPDGKLATSSPAIVKLNGSSEVPLIPVLEEIASVDFGTNDIFTTSTQNITLENSGNIPLIISEISILVGRNNEQFNIESLTFPIEIAPFSTFNFSATFSPTSSFTGSQNDYRNALVKVISNHNNETDNEKTFFLQSKILTPKFNITTKDYNLGNVFINQNNTTTLTLENNGDGTLVLDRHVLTEVGNFTVEGTTFPLNILPNSTKDVTVKFNPTTVGNKTTLLSFYAANEERESTTSGFKQKFIYVTLTGKGIDKTLNQPADIAFNDTRIGQTDNKNFTLQAINGASVDISNIIISGDDASNFSITSSKTKTLNVGENFNVNVSFTATKLGNHTAILQIVSDASNNPVSVKLNGNGINSELEITPTSFIFDDTVIKETSAPKEVTLSNTNGTDVVSISAININGDNASEFKIDETISFPINIAAGATKNIETFFTPLTFGNKTTTVEIISNDSNSPQKITLEGIALSPIITTNTDVISFPKTDVSNKRIQYYSIKNTGTSDLKINSINFLGDAADNFLQESTTAFPLIIPPNSEEKLQVTYKPLTAGLKVATIQVNTEKIGIKEIGLIATATSPVLEVSNNIDFGTFNKTTEDDTHPITIKNTGTSNLIIYRIEKSGTDATVFSIENTFPITIKPNESGVINTKFSFSSDGEKNAIFKFITNSPEEKTINLKTNLTNLPTFKAQAYFPLNSGEVGEKTYTPYEIENTGSAPLIIDGFLSLRSTSCCTSIEANHILPEEYKDYNKFPLTIPAGEKKSILITFQTGITDGDKPIKVEAFLAINKATNSFDDYFLHDGDFISVTFGGGVLRPEFEITSPTPLAALETSIGRISEVDLSIKNTGNAPLQLWEITNDYANGFYFKDYPPYVIELEPEESVDFTIIFDPNGDFGIKNGLLKIRTRGDGTYNNPFVIHDIPISGVAVKPKEVTANGMIFKGDRITINGDISTLSGNVHAENLEFNADVSVNTVTNVVTTNGQVFVLNVKKQGDLGGDKVLLADGELKFKIDKDVQKVANLSLLAGSKITNKAFSLVGIPIKLTKIKLIDDGVQVGAKLTLPPAVFGEDSHITVETLEISKSRGVNIKGSAAINPDLKVLKILSLNSASVTFDTFTNSFSAKGEIELSLINQKVTIKGELAIINGGLDTVSLDVESSGGVPIANSGLALAGGNGFIKDIQNPPISLGLGVDIIPVAPPIETIRFDNLQIAYTFGTSLEASGNVKLFGELLGSANLALYLNTIDNIYGFKVGAYVNAYNVLRGSADLTVQSRNSNFYIEGNSKLSVTVPKIKCFICAPIDKFLPYKVATVQTYFNNTKISASLNVAKIIDVYVKIESRGKSYRTTFGGNFKPLNISFKSGLAAKGLNTNNLVFENNLSLQDIDPLEGRSLIVNSRKNQRFKGKGTTTNIPFNLKKNYKTIILRLEGTNNTPSYTVELPNGTEVTPENAESLGHYQSNYNENKQNYYILNNVVAGNYIFKINGTDKYQADIAGAEFAPDLTVDSINYTPINNELKINWTDSDLDSDAEISFYYATDTKGNGTQIVTGISEDSTKDSYIFDTSSLKNGTYYIYGKIDDDNNIPEISYSTQTFTVNKASKVEVPILTSNVFNNTIQLSWSPVDKADHYLVYIDDKLVSNLSSNENAGSDTFYDIVNLAPGKKYQFAVTAVKADLTESNLSNIETINFVSSTINNVPVILTETLPEKKDACSIYKTVINATDMDAKDVLTYSLIIAPEGMILNNNQIEWTPNNTQLGSQQVIIQLNDNNGGVVSKNYEIIINKIDDKAPVVNVASLPEIVSENSFTVVDIPTATDACKGIINGVANKTEFTTLGEHTIVWTFNDGNGNSVTANQKVTIKDTTAPIIPTLADINEECSSTPTVPTTTDTYAGSITGTTTTSFPITKQGTTIVTWTFNDGNGNSVTANQNVIIKDTIAPIIPTLADINEAYSVSPTQPTTTDACAGTITGTTTTSFPITKQGTTVVTWTFNDGNGNSVTANQNVIIKDTTPPIIPTLADINEQCSATPTAPTATDTYVGTITGTTTTSFPITKQGTTIVTWTFNDGNGNSVTANQNVIIKDTTKPVIPTLADINEECSATPTAPTTTDACGGLITGVTLTSFPITKKGTTIVTWFFNDGNGNFVKAEQNVIIKDTKSPIILAKNISIDLELTGTKTITVDDIDEGSTDNCKILSKSLSKNTFTSADIGENIIEYTITDFAGNKKIKSITVTVNNNTLSVDDFNINLNNSVKLYPNPANAVIKLKYDTSSIKINKIDVFDLLGKKVNNINLQLEANEINVNQLANGMYLLRIISDKGIVTKQFLKQ